MKIGDLEYHKTIVHAFAAATTPESEDIGFALGIRIRPLLVRTHVTIEVIGAAATNQIRCYLENGASVVPADTAAMQNDPRLMAIGHLSWFLTTSGFDVWVPPKELNWSMLLRPTVRIHFEGTSTAERVKTTLFYRFAELTSDEIVELAAQRAGD